MFNFFNLFGKFERIFKTQQGRGFLILKKKCNLFYLNNRGFLFLDLFLLNKGCSEVNYIFFKDKCGYFVLKTTTVGCVADSNSTIVYSLEWFERELKEFDFFFFKNLKDSRCLLTPYNSVFKKSRSFLIKNNFLFFNVFFKKLENLKKLKVRL